MTIEDFAGQAAEEIARLRQAGELEQARRDAPRCYICCEPASRNLVNKLLATGFTYAEIVACCGGINEDRRQAGDGRIITLRSVGHHRREHFNVDDPARSVYRAIVERRAGEANRDYDEALGHAVTSYAVVETAMVKGYANLVDPDTLVSPREAVNAAVKLHEMTSLDIGQHKMAEMLFTLDRIITAAREFIPKDSYEAFLAKVEGRSATPVPERRKIETVRKFTPPTALDVGDEI